MQTVNGLDQFEALAEQLVEGTFERLFHHRLHPSDVARQLARAMEDGQSVNGGQVIFPGQYWVFLNSDDFAALDAGGDALRVGLARYLQRLAHEAGGRFGGQLRVTLHPVADLPSGQVDVRAAHTTQSSETDDTREVRAADRSTSQAGRWTLHVAGREVRLGEPVIRLGRSLSNDIILEDARVSRRHAQLRWRASTYYLSDLDSSGGTIVNHRVLGRGEEVSLADGDTISLAGVTLTVTIESDQPSVDVAPTPPMPDDST
jgi:hypothetical protein